MIGTATDCLQKQGGLPSPRIPADQNHPAGHHTASQGPVQLANAAQASLDLARLYFRQILHGTGPCQCRKTMGIGLRLDGLLLNNGIPLITLGEASLPTRTFRPTGGTDKNAA